MEDVIARARSARSNLPGTEEEIASPPLAARNDVSEMAVVECYSGSEYAERPIAFQWEGQRLEIAAIEAQWRTPEGKRFRVKVSEGREFELTYLEPDDQWSVREV